jgi:CubicO group peptidase (beta-lactamase class C family)
MKFKSILSRLMLLLATLACWLSFVFFTAFSGWWMFPVVSPNDPAAFFSWATTTLERENAAGNSALVLIEDGRIFSEFYRGAKAPIDTDTVFSTASMSKWIAAHGAMQAVLEGRLDLDAPVADYLSRWELPVNGFDPAGVTVRRLLSHTAGFADGLGFGDYRLDEALPTLEEELSMPRASSGDPVRIEVSITPGSEWRYSGGGYLLLELVIEEVTGMRFEQYMQQRFFDPLNMQRSTYASLDTMTNNAGSLTRSGEPAEITHYASSAATAFATSASDLSRFVLAQIPQSNASRVLALDTVALMREPHGRSFGADIWGLGTMLYAPTPNGDVVFGHDGGNEPAINSAARINPDTGDALIVLETGHPSLATTVGSQWVLWQTGTPDFLDIDAVIASMVWPAIIGALIILFLLLTYWRLAARKRNSAVADKLVT